MKAIKRARTLPIRYATCTDMVHTPEKNISFNAFFLWMAFSLQMTAHQAKEAKALTPKNRSINPVARSPPSHLVVQLYCDLRRRLLPRLAIDLRGGPRGAPHSSTDIENINLSTRHDTQSSRLGDNIFYCMIQRNKAKVPSPYQFITLTCMGSIPEVRTCISRHCATARARESPSWCKTRTDGPVKRHSGVARGSEKACSQ